MYEGSLRVPAVVRWPGRVAAGTTTDHMALSMDVFATACDIAGVSPTAHGDIPLDAVSFLPVLFGKTPPSIRDDAYFVRREGGVASMGKTSEAVIRGDWKLVANSPYRPLELYNLARDPEERNDLADCERKIVAELAAILSGHVQRGGQVPWQGGR